MTKVLKEMILRISNKESFILQGPQSSGKSVLINMLKEFYKDMTFLYFNCADASEEKYVSDFIGRAMNYKKLKPDAEIVVIMDHFELKYYLPVISIVDAFPIIGKTCDLTLSNSRSI